MRSILNFAVIISVLVLLPGCRISVDSAHSNAMQANSESAISLQYGEPRELSQLKDPRIDESSGIAASFRYKDAFWTHNDSGDSARIFLIDKEGNTLSVVNIKEVSAVDWEDIASFRIGDQGYVLIADVGDNARQRENCVLYIIREPLVNIRQQEDGEAPNVEIEADLRIRYHYEDGPHDCEAVAVDPTNSTIYLASKDAEECRVYSMLVPQKESREPGIAKLIASLKVGYANSMDISPDGRRAVILTYGDAYEFSRGKVETWAQAFSREPRPVKAPVRRQGEAICYGTDGKTLYLTSEYAHQPLWEIPFIEDLK